MDTFFLVALIVLIVGLGVFVIAAVRLERSHGPHQPKGDRL